MKRDYDDTKGGGSLITWTYRASGACRPMPQFLYTMQGGEWQVKPLVDDYCPETERRTSRDGATLMGEERREYNDAGDLLRIEEIHHDLDNLRTGQLFTYDVAGNLLTKFWLRDGSVVPHATYDYGCWPR